MGMAAYRLRVGASGPPDSTPAWRTAMTAEDTLYYVGTSTPESAAALTGPTSPVASHMGNTGAGTSGAGWDVISGYSSGVLIESEGNYGAMVYGTGGHKIIANQLLKFDISADDPTFTWWQDPTYQTSDTAGANLYYNPAEQASLVAGPRGLAAQFDFASDQETPASVTRWDRAFPVAYEGWIFHRKLTTGQMGDSVPHGFRYANQCYIPASVTGGAPLYWAGLGPQGPFVQSYAPALVTDSEWMDASVLSSGSRRWPYYFRNVTTGAWTEHQWQPLGIGYGGFGGQRAGVFTDNKRMYVCTYVSGSPSWYYIDFTAGLAGHTISTPVTGVLEMSKYSSGAFSDGDSAGRHFCVAPARLGTASTKVVVYDFDAGTSFYVDFASNGMSIDEDNEWVGASYDRVNQRVLIVVRDPTTRLVEYWSIYPAATLSNTAGWTASKRTLAASDSNMVSSAYTSNTLGDGLSNFYGKVRFIPSLGVVLIPSNRQRMLAFRPSE